MLFLFDKKMLYIALTDLIAICNYAVLTESAPLECFMSHAYQISFVASGSLYCDFNL